MHFSVLNVEYRYIIQVFCAVVTQVLQLKVTIGNLVMTMIEENSVESLVVATVGQFVMYVALCTQ